MQTDIKAFENQMKDDIEAVFTNILAKHNYIVNISSKARSGAEISDFLEDSFVDYINNNQHERISNPKGAPKDNPKNPYDFCFEYHNDNFKDIIWGDIKATKHSYKDSNPDLGTPEKIIKFILEGHFYLMFVFFEYESLDNQKTQFVKFSDGKYVHCQFLKDIHHSVRINPKPQFQVNINEPEEYRTIDEFIELFHQKYKESIERIIKKQEEKKHDLDSRFEKIRQQINKYNNKFK